MATFPAGLISDDEAKATFALKTKRHFEQTVRGTVEGSVEKRKEALELEGWQVAKKNKNSYRMRKEKPVDEQLEDDVWSMLYRLGFKELNQDRNFKFNHVPGTNDRQWDIFARDDETVFIVECTHSRDKGEKSLLKLFDRIEAARGTITQQIHAHYGKEPKLKVKFGIATTNVEWKDGDLERADRMKVARITERDVEYYNSLVRHLKKAARYQFLGRYLAGEKVDGLRDVIYAIEGHIKKRRFFQFLISPHELLKFCFISHKGKSSIDDLETYQRMVRPKRLDAIGEYINEDGVFPTNIVLNFKTGSPLDFQQTESLGGLRMGRLTLPALYGSAWIIDGQHRVYGYTRSKRDEATDKAVVSVLAYENMPINEEIRMFIDINSEQVKVDKTIVNELIANLNVEAKDPEDRLAAIRARLVLNLSEKRGSTLYERVSTVSDAKTQHRCLKLTSLTQAIEEPRLLGSVKSSKGGGKEWSPSFLGKDAHDSAGTLRRAAEILDMYFAFFRDGLPSHWDAGDAEGGYLCTNNGIRSLLYVLAEIFKWIEKQTGSDISDMTIEQIRDEIHDYVLPLVHYFKSASPEQIKAYRSKGSSGAIVVQNAKLMQIIIHEENPTFAPAEIVAAAGRRDEQGTVEAKVKIDEINRIVFDDIVKRLKAAYTTTLDEWWRVGIPQKTRIAADTRYNQDPDPSRPREMHLVMEDYAAIVTNSENWDLFVRNYDFSGRSVRSRSGKVQWLKEILQYRNVTHNSHKGPLERQEVDRVRLIHSLVLHHIQKNHPVPEGENLLDVGRHDGDLDEAA